MPPYGRMPAHGYTFPPCPSCPCPTPSPTASTSKTADTPNADHGVTKALARASITMDRVDLWKARLAVKTLRRDQREAIAEAGE